MSDSVHGIQGVLASAAITPFPDGLVWKSVDTFSNCVSVLSEKKTWVMSSLMTSFLGPGRLWPRSAELLVGVYQCVCVCVCVSVPVSSEGVCFDRVSPLGVIPGDTAEESSLYSHPTELPPALNKDTEACRCNNTHTNTHTHTHKGLDLAHSSSKLVHYSLIRGNSSSLSKSSNLEKDGETARLASNVLTAEETGNMNTHSNSLFSPSLAQFHPSKAQRSLSVIEHFVLWGEMGFQNSQDSTGFLQNNNKKISVWGRDGLKGCKMEKTKERKSGREQVSGDKLPVRQQRNPNSILTSPILLQSHMSDEAEGKKVQLVFPLILTLFFMAGN